MPVLSGSTAFPVTHVGSTPSRLPGARFSDSTKTATDYVSTWFQRRMSGTRCAQSSSAVCSSAS